MFLLPDSVKILVCTAPADLRRGFDGLAALTREVIEQDPLSGQLFVFANRRGNRLKILWWQHGGYCLFYRRLERGTFRLPRSTSSSMKIDAATLTLILEGIDLSEAKRRVRFSLPARRKRTG
jgi:transposase